MLVTRGLGPGSLLPTFGLGTAGVLIIQDPNVLVLPLFADIADLSAFVSPTNNPAVPGTDSNTAIHEVDALNFVVNDLVKEFTKATINKELFCHDIDVITTITSFTTNTAWVDVDANNAIGKIFSSNTLVD